MFLNLFQFPFQLSSVPQLESAFSDPFSDYLLYNKRIAAPIYCISGIALNY